MLGPNKLRTLLICCTKMSVYYKRELVVQSYKALIYKIMSNIPVHFHIIPEKERSAQTVSSANRDKP